MTASGYSIAESPNRIVPRSLTPRDEEPMENANSFGLSLRTSPEKKFQYLTTNELYGEVSSPLVTTLKLLQLSFKDKTNIFLWKSQIGDQDVRANFR